MASLQETFSKGLTAINVKSNNFMEVNKIKTQITSLESDIKNLKMNIGELTYASWVGGFDSKEQIDGYLAQIKTKMAEIEAANKEIENIQEQEKQILGSESDAAPKVFCTNCGAPNKVGFKFCEKCGTPLQ